MLDGDFTLLYAQLVVEPDGKGTIWGVSYPLCPFERLGSRYLVLREFYIPLWRLILASDPIGSLAASTMVPPNSEVSSPFTFSSLILIPGHALLWELLAITSPSSPLLRDPRSQGAVAGADENFR